MIDLYTLTRRSRRYAEIPKVRMVCAVYGRKHSGVRSGCVVERGLTSILLASDLRVVDSEENACCSGARFAKSFALAASLFAQRQTTIGAIVRVTSRLLTGRPL